MTNPNDPMHPTTRMIDKRDAPTGKVLYTTHENVPGLTKREYYAGLAMNGLISTGQKQTDIDNARVAVAFADALIARLNEEPSK